MIVSDNIRQRYDTIISGITESNDRFDYNYAVSKPLAVMETIITGYRFPNGNRKCVLPAISKVPPYGLNQYKKWMPNEVSNTITNIRQVGVNVLSYDSPGGYGMVYYSNGLVYDRRYVYAVFLLDNNDNMHAFFNMLSDNIQTNMLRGIMKNLRDSDFMHIYTNNGRHRVASSSECDMSCILKRCDTIL